MNQPTTITETESEWARDAAYALDHIDDPNTFTSEAMEHIAPRDIEADARFRRAREKRLDDFYKFIHDLARIPARKDEQ